MVSVDSGKFEVIGTGLIEILRRCSRR